MDGINLSYVVTNYNKLLYLKEVLTALIANKSPDEEIIVTDGKSNDGSCEWLQRQKEEGKINIYLSEKDEGEAHGFNKAMMLAKGELIKIITSDDVYYYPAIKKCKEYMLGNNDVDVLTSVISSIDLVKARLIIDHDTIPSFQRWKNNEVPYFYFNCIPLMLRRSQLPKLGLLHTGFTMVDYEYSMRVSRIANIAVYTRPIGIRVFNQTSNLLNMGDNKMAIEYLKTDFMYDKLQLKRAYEYSFGQLINAILYKIRCSIALRSRLKKMTNNKNRDKADVNLNNLSVHDLFTRLHRMVEEDNKTEGEFLFYKKK